MEDKKKTGVFIDSDRLKMEMKHKHITQEKLSLMIDRSLRHVNRGIAGGYIDIYLLKDICKTLDVDVDYIIGLRPVLKDGTVPKYHETTSGDIDLYIQREKLSFLRWLNDSQIVTEVTSAYNEIKSDRIDRESLSQFLFDFYEPIKHGITDYLTDFSVSLYDVGGVIENDDEDD